jgi:hypothetical protein
LMIQLSLPALDPQEAAANPMTATIPRVVEEVITRRLCITEHGHRHAAFLFPETKPSSHYIACGYNIYPEFSDICSIHAEECAINKLKPISGRKRLKTLNICVLRVCNSGKLGSSRPCYHCIRMMSTKAPRLGYRINWVYFSTSDGRIDRCKLSHLAQCDDLHLSAFHRKDREPEKKPAQRKKIC